MFRFVTLFDPKMCGRSCSETPMPVSVTSTTAWPSFWWRARLTLPRTLRIQTAFDFGLILDWARHVKDEATEKLIGEVDRGACSGFPREGSALPAGVRALRARLPRQAVPIGYPFSCVTECAPSTHRRLSQNLWSQNLWSLDLYGFQRLSQGKLEIKDLSPVSTQEASEKGKE
jgi:hypothetical protein